MASKTVVFSFDDPEEAVEFVAFVQEKLRKVNMDIVLKHNKVKVVLLGTREEVELASNTLKREYRYWKLSSKRRPGGLYRHSLSIVLSRAELASSIPVNSIVEVLELSGYRAELKEGFVETDAELDRVVEVAEKLSRVYRELLSERLTPMARRLVAVLMTAYSLGLEETLRACLEEGVLYTDEKSSRTSLVVEYGTALERAAERLRTGRDIYKPGRGRVQEARELGGEERRRRRDQDTREER